MVLFEYFPTGSANNQATWHLLLHNLLICEQPADTHRDVDARVSSDAVAHTVQDLLLLIDSLHSHKTRRMAMFC